MNYVIVIIHKKSAEQKVSSGSRQSITTTTMTTKSNNNGITTELCDHYHYATPSFITSSTGSRMIVAKKMKEDGSIWSK